MTNSNTVITDPTGRTAIATNFLSSLTSSLGAGGGLSGLFESLLAAAQQQGAAATTNTDTTATNPVSGGDPSTVNPAFASLNDIFSALHDFGVKWGNHHDDAQTKDNSGSTNGNQQHNTSPAPTSSSPPSSPGASSSSGSAPSAPSSTSNTNAGTGSTTPTTTNAATTNPSTTGTTADTGNATGASDTSGTTDPTAPLSFADLLAELQSILQMLQKQIQTAQGTSNTSGTGGTTGTTATTADATNIAANTQGLQDLLAAGGALADLLALAQKIEKKFGMPSGDSSTETAGAGATIDPNLAALDTQLRTNLQTLVNNLQTAAAANTPVINATDTAVTVTPDASLLTTPTTPAAGTTGVAAMPSTPSEIIKGALATADDFLKQLNSLYTASNPVPFAAAVAANALSPASNSNGTPPDANQDNSAPAAASLNSSGATTQDAALQTATTTDGVKSANPYSFASQLSATRAQNGGTVGLPSAVEQVLLLLNKNAKSGNDQMSLQLHPADLGSINVKLDFAGNGTVSGTVVASNADTLAMLQKDQRSLERALQDAGLQVDPGSLQFSLGDPSNSGNSSQTQNQSSGDTSSDTTASGLAALTPDSDFDTTDSWIITPNRVNIQV